MESVRIERLTSRHRDCLRLVAANHSTKEIAKVLNLSPNTVDGYIGEAKDILGSATRRDAARQFQAFINFSDPQKLGGASLRVAANRGLPPETRGEQEVFQALATDCGDDGLTALVEGQIGRDSFHWFRGERGHNTLTPQQRLLWIAIGSMVAAFVFVAAVTSIDTLTRLLARPSL